MKHYNKQLTRLFQLTILLNIIIVSYQASHIQSVKTRIKETVSHDPDQTSKEYSSINKREVREIQNSEGGTQIVGGSRQTSHRRRSGVYFSPWSPWNNCDFECKQTRERYCVTRRKCGEMKHIEERLCPRNLCSPVLSTNLHQKPQQQQQQNINLNQRQLQQEQQQHQQLNDNIKNNNDDDDDDDDGDEQHNYFVIKKRTKTKKKRRKTIIIDVDDDDDFRYINDIDDQQQQQQQQNIEHNIDDNDKRQLLFKENIRNKNKLNKNRQQLQQKLNNEQITDDDTTNENHDDDDDNLHHIKSIENYPQINFYGIETTDKITSKRTISTSNFSLLVPADDKYNTHRQEWDGIEWIPIPVQDNYNNNLENINSNEEISTEIFDDYNTESGEISSSSSDELEFNDNSSVKQIKTLPKKKRIMEKAVFDAPPKYRRVYSKWTKWSKCSPKCTTRRFKRCRMKEVCGNEVLRDIAYCYVEGTFCQEWIKSQMHNINKGRKPIPRPSEISALPYNTNSNVNPTYNTNSNTNRRQSSVYTNSVTQYPQYPQKSNPYRYSTPQNFQCGVPAVRRRARYNTYNMLKIIGGKVARRGMWPWQVVVLNGHKEPFCGGTLVSPQWVLSAAHCYKRKLYVILGEHNLAKRDGTEVEYQIVKFIKHPRYNKSTVDNDVAMMKLPSSALLNNYIGLACLPQRYQNLPIGTQCKIIGWGKRYNTAEAGTNVLHEAEVPIISTSECETVYNDYTITNNMFCAGHKKGRIDTCAGDSGGPILCRDARKSDHPWTIFGITSFGDGCGKINKFGIYTKLPNYVDWIWEIINCNGDCKYL